MRLGSHVSVAGKIYLAVARAKAIGCQTMQIFSGNPRSWQPAVYSGDDVSEFKKRRRAAGIDPVAIHLPYLVNLGSASAGIHRQSIAAVLANLEQAKILGANYLVVHAGSHAGAGSEKGLAAIKAALTEILNQPFGGVVLLLENTAGSRYALGSKMEDLAGIFEHFGIDSRLGLCLDTCHAFAAGYDLAGDQGLNGLLDKIDRLFGLEKLKFMHLNDCRGRLGSGTDRHEHIGKGFIGMDGFRRLVNHPRLQNIAGVIETPKMGSEDDGRNLALLRQAKMKQNYHTI